MASVWYSMLGILLSVLVFFQYLQKHTHHVFCQKNVNPCETGNEVQSPDRDHSSMKEGEEREAQLISKVVVGLFFRVFLFLSFTTGRSEGYGRLCDASQDDTHDCD